MAATTPPRPLCRLYLILYQRGKRRGGAGDAPRHLIIVLQRVTRGEHPESQVLLRPSDGLLERTVQLRLGPNEEAA
jgi:hypothetical protein